DLSISRPAGRAGAAEQRPVQPAPARGEPRLRRGVPRLPGHGPGRGGAGRLRAEPRRARNRTGAGDLRRAARHVRAGHRAAAGRRPADARGREEGRADARPGRAAPDGTLLRPLPARLPPALPARPGAGAGAVRQGRPAHRPAPAAAATERRAHPDPNGRRQRRPARRRPGQHRGDGHSAADARGAAANRVGRSGNLGRARRGRRGGL
ncbi:MAG: hypothetical protein AVDCRST_MAG08-4159, partial [uncultured Acetobacteraceae bacterium]